VALLQRPVQLCYDDLDEMFGYFPAVRAEVSPIGWWSLIRVPLIGDVGRHPHCGQMSTLGTTSTGHQRCLSAHAIRRPFISIR
jgi:hypothetical protein